MNKERIHSKRCPRCDFPKWAYDYFPDSSKPDGLAVVCKRCHLIEIKAKKDKRKCNACIVSDECPKSEVTK